MLTFEEYFYPDGMLGCFLWANEIERGWRGRFNIRPEILDVLDHPVHEGASVALCEKNRDRIEAACRRGFARALNRQSESIDLQLDDFTEKPVP